MRTLAQLDYVVIGVYLTLVFILGIALTRKASHSMEDFFVGGRSLPWWLIGVSMAATNFSIDTPVAVCKFIVTEGISGVWFLWASAISAIFVTFFFSRLWRRAGVITDAEFIELRYSGAPARALRLFKGIYFGVIFNAFIMGWVFLSLTKVMKGVTDLNMDLILWGSVVLVFVYSVASGFYGVVLTDFLQYFMALGGSIILAFLALKEVGGIESLVSGIQDNANPGPSALHFFPRFSEESMMPMSIFFAYIFIQWWAHKYADGGGKHIQRMLSAKDENHAFKGSALYTVLTYALQVWPWIITALCAMVLISDLKDPEMAYSMMMAKVLPHGLLGFVVVCLIGAFMSTIDTHLNLGASYIVNDIYKRFLVKEASPAHYVWISRLMMGFLLGLDILISKNLDSVGSAWKFLLTFASGAGLTWIIRWFWWRANAWTEFSAMLTSGIVASWAHHFHPEWIYSTKLMVTVGISTLTWLVVTFTTRPVEEETLVKFLKRVRPGSPGWNKIYQRHGMTPGSFLLDGVRNWVLGMIAFFSLNFSIGFLVFQDTAIGLSLLILALVSGAYVLNRKPGNPQPTEDDLHESL